MSEKISRRDFIKLGFGATAGLSLSSLLKGCTIPLIETQEEVDAVLESHVAIPTPKGGCYVGWHNNTVPYLGRDREKIWPKVDKEDEEKKIESYRKRFGHLPAVHSFSHDNVREDFYPRNLIEGAHSMGVFPLMRFYPTPSWKRVSQGAIDEDMHKFASEAAASKPSFFVPWPEAGSTPPSSHPWQRWDPKYFKPAWDRLYNIADKVKANKKLVWGLHLLGSFASIRSRKYFLVDPATVHWVGITLSENRTGGRRSFYRLLGPDYYDLTSAYETKPFAFWEIATRNNSFAASDRETVSFGKWLLNAYNTIRKKPRVKLVSWWEGGSYKIPGTKKLKGPTYILGKSVQYYQKATADPYFIKGPYK